MATDYLHDLVLVLRKAAQVPLVITLFVRHDHRPGRIIIFPNELSPFWHIDGRSFADGIQLFGHSDMTDGHWWYSHVEKEIHLRLIPTLWSNTEGEGVCASVLLHMMNRPVMQWLLQKWYRKCYLLSLNFAQVRFVCIRLLHDSDGPVDAFGTKAVVFTWVGALVSFRRIDTRDFRIGCNALVYIKYHVSEGTYSNSHYKILQIMAWLL